MSEEMKLPEELAEVERALGGLMPARALGGLDRDRVMYEAGRGAALRAGRVRMRLWQGLCGVLVVACAGLAAFPRERVVERVVAVHVPATVTTPAPAPAAVKPAPGAAAEPRVAYAPPGDGAVDEDGVLAGLLRLRHGAPGEGRGPRQGGGGGANVPALKPGDGLEAVPAWQKRAAMTGGKQS
jgi:hypothetical protein